MQNAFFTVSSLYMLRIWCIFFNFCFFFLVVYKNVLVVWMLLITLLPSTWVLWLWAFLFLIHVTKKWTLTKFKINYTSLRFFSFIFITVCNVLAKFTSNTTNYVSKLICLSFQNIFSGTVCSNTWCPHFWYKS